MKSNSEKSSVTKDKNGSKFENSTRLESFAPPDGGYGWVIVFASFMAHFIIFGIWNTSGIIFVRLLQDLRTGKAETALISSISIGTMFVSGPLSSILYNRLGPRVTSVTGSIIAACGYVASHFAVDILFLYISMGMIVGLGFGIAFVPFIVTIGFYFDKKKSIAVGVSVCGQGVGTIVWAPVMETLLETYGWRGSMLVVAGIVFNTAVMGSLLRPIKTGVDVEISVRTDHVQSIENGYNISKKDGKIGNESVSKRSESCDIYLYDKAEGVVPNQMEYEHLLFQNEDFSSNEMPALSTAKTKDLRHEVTLKNSLNFLSRFFDFSLFKDTSLVIFLLSNFFVVLGILSPFIYLPDRAAEGGSTKAESALFISVIGFTNTLGRIVVAVIADCTRVNRQLLYTLALIVCGSVTIASPFNDSVVYLGIYSAIFGFSMGVFFCLFFVVLMDLVTPDKFGDATGVVLLIHGIAVLIGPPFVGWIYGVSKNYDCTFYAIGSVIVIGGLTMCFIPRERRSK